MPDTRRRRTFDVDKQRERPVPACKTRFRAGTHWVRKEWGPALAEFLRPCQRERCFGGEGPDEPLDGQTVVRSAGHPTAAHRVGLTLAEDGYGDESNDPDPSNGPRERGGTGPLPALARDHDWPEPERLASVGDLRVGDAVAWGTRETPLAVIATEWPLEPEATVRGPDGGTYTLEERGPRDFWVYPSHGRVARVVHFPADPAADPATDTPLSE